MGEVRRACWLETCCTVYDAESGLDLRTKWRLQSLDIALSVGQRLEV